MIAKGYEVRDLGSGPQSAKIQELAKSIQIENKGELLDELALLPNAARGIYLTGRSRLNGSPLTNASSQVAALIANKHFGVYATICDDVHIAKASRSLLGTNLLVLVGDETRVQEIVEGWIGQEVGAPPRSRVGEIPDWWPDDDETIDMVAKEYCSVMEDIESAEDKTNSRTP